MPALSRVRKLVFVALALVVCRVVSQWQSVVAGFAALVILAVFAVNIIASMPRVRKVLLLAALPLTTLLNAAVFALGAFIILLGVQGLLVYGRIGHGPAWNWVFALVPLAAAANLAALAQPSPSRWRRCAWLANLALVGYGVWYWRAEEDYALMVGFAVPLVATAIIGLPIVSLTTLTWSHRAQASANAVRPARPARRVVVLTSAMLICGLLWSALFPVYRKRQIARSLDTFGLSANFGIIFPGWKSPIELPFDLYAYLGEVNGAAAPEALRGDAGEAGRLLNTLPWLDVVIVNHLPAGSGRILQPLAAHARLRQIALKGAGVTDETLADAGRIPALNRAVFDRAQITDGGLANLAGAKWLQALVIRRTPICGDGLVHLTSLPRLTELDLSGTDVGDRQVAVLPQLTTLLSLSLDGAPLTDQALASLAQCKKLQLINLSGTHVTASGVERLERALPACRIIWSTPADAP